MGTEKKQSLDGILKPSILVNLEKEYLDKNKLGIIKVLEDAWKESLKKNRVSVQEGCLLIIPKEQLKLFSKGFITDYLKEKGWNATFNFNLDNSNPNIYIKLNVIEGDLILPLDESENPL